MVCPFCLVEVKGSIIVAPCGYYEMEISLTVYRGNGKGSVSWKAQYLSTNQSGDSMQELIDEVLGDQELLDEFPTPECLTVLRIRQAIVRELKRLIKLGKKQGAKGLDEDSRGLE